MDEMLGLKLDRLDQPLQLAEQRQRPHVERPAQRFAEAHPDYVEEFLHVRRDLETWWSDSGFTYAPYDLLEQVFSPDELVRLWWCSFVSSKVSDHLENDEYGAVVDKVRHSLWRWGHSDTDYNHFVRMYRGLSRMRLMEDDPRFSLRLDHSGPYNERGYAVHHRDIYLDGCFGYVVYYRGKAVMVIGVSPSHHGLLVHQVQTLKPRGNRWLYKLPGGPGARLEHVLKRLIEAFEGLDIWLVDGDSAARAVRRSYCADERDAFTRQHARHIEQLYNGPLYDLSRGGTTRCNGVDFHRIVDGSRHPLARTPARAWARA